MYAGRVTSLINLVYAHRYSEGSRANRALFAGVRDMPGLEVRGHLYDQRPTPSATPSRLIF
jgi:hypothetical protein